MKRNVISDFYEAFQKKDFMAMKQCYAAEVKFEDPAFGKLIGKDVGIMWEMLCKNSKDLFIEFEVVAISETEGKVNWLAKYTFSKTGRKVTNKIQATFKIRDGKIVEHTDEFNLYRWAQQAFGPIGWLIGWTKFFRNKLQKQTNHYLAKFKSQ